MYFNVSLRVLYEAPFFINKFLTYKMNFILNTFFIFVETYKLNNMKITKKHIQSVLRIKDRTQIYKLAHLMGVNTKYPLEVLDFALIYSPSNNFTKNAYRIIVLNNKKRYSANYFDNNQLCISKCIQSAKNEVQYIGTSYFKVLIEGHNNIYWASPFYQHSDYNKSIAMPKNDFNLKAMNLINKVILNYY